MKKIDEIKKVLAQYKQEIRERFKVKEIGIFGSYVRNEQKNKSDIDILVEFKEEADLFDFFGLTLFLEERLNQKVDIVPKSALKEELREYILREVAYI